MSLKSELICNICQMILSDPVTLPCSSMICGEHLQDGANKHVRIRCLKCDTEFDVPKELHLDEKEKSIRHAIQLLIPQMEQLQVDLKRKHSNLQRSCPDHFSKIRRNIDSQRGILSSNFVLKISELVEKKEESYNLIMEESLLVGKAVNLLKNEFQRPVLNIEEVKRTLDEIKQRVEELQTSLGSLDDVKIKSPAFTESQVVQEDSLNGLKLATQSIAYCYGNTISIKNLESN